MTPKTDESILDVFLLGLKTWLAEIKWLTRTVLGRFEVGRLEKELEREYASLGRIAEAPRGRMEEKERCLKQIDFLRDEIAALRGEMARDREERMAKLRQETNDQPGEAS